MTVIYTTVQRLYLMQLSMTTVPLPTGQSLSMSSGCYLVQTSDGKNILIDSGSSADYTLPVGMPPARGQKNVLAMMASSSRSSRKRQSIMDEL
ncbi:MAG TPA: hypothetical protein VKV40_24270 [Ktedonobacteraceae bacterium]|nr:hypothetical protein [Ktedonobacteraceae bacterium]